MTDAKPVEVGELIARLNHVRRIVGNMCSELRPPKMSIPARPDCDEDFIISATVKDSQAALLALQAKVARLTQERDAYLAELRGPVKNGAVQKLGKALTRILDSDAWNGIEPLLNSAKAERDRLTQENARLAKHAKAMRDAARTKGMLQSLLATLDAVHAYEKDYPQEARRNE